MFWTRLNNGGLIVAILKSYMGILGGLFLIHIQIKHTFQIALQTLLIITSDKIREPTRVITTTPAGDGEEEINRVVTL